ncbi:hypothetical protein [Streptomyces sp. NPDC003996]
MAYLPLTRYAALAASARAQVRPHRIAAPPVQMAELAHRLVHTPAVERRALAADLDDRTLLDVLVVLELHTGSAYELWHDTPSGFAEDVLGLTLTSGQRAVLDVVVGEDVRQVAARVPRSDNHLMAAVLTAWSVLVSCPQPRGDVPRTAIGLAPYRQHAEDVWHCLAGIVESAVLPGKVLVHRRLWLTESPERVLGYAVWNVEPPPRGPV